VLGLPQVAGASWTCVAAGGASCAAGPVAGNLADTISVPVGGSATYTLQLTLRSSAAGNLTNQASVALAAGASDPGPSNNTALDTDTRGTGIMHHRFLDYGPWAGPLAGRKRGVLVADREGSVVAFALGNLQERAQMFVKPGDLVYEGMIAGENSRPGDLDVNVTKEKKLTNMRTTASDENVILEPPREITLEYALEYIEEDELIEVTPKTIRLRKRVLPANDRKKAARAARVADAS